MKKVMLLAMMAAVTMTVSAQDEAFKNAKKLFDKGSVDEAIQTVQPALTAGTDEDKAAAWNLLSAAQYKKFSDIQAKKIENQVKQSNEPVDEAAMNAAAIAALEAAMKCDEFDSKPNEKGKVKLKYRGENQKIYQNGRLQAINAGQYLYNQKDYKGAFKAFAIYVDSGESPLFTGIDMSQDQYKHEVAYFASLAAYQEKDYENVIKYAQIAAQDESKAKDATEILVFSKKETMKSKQDTLEYISMLKEASANFPEGEIAKNPDDKFGYTYKGEALRLSGKFDEAVECYKKAFELDPTYIAAAYQAGVSLNSKAIELKDQLADKKTGKLTVENANKIKAILTDAKTYLEKVRELDPDRSQVNWAYALYQMYYSLGDNEKANELEKLLGQ